MRMGRVVCEDGEGDVRMGRVGCEDGESVM